MRMESSRYLGSQGGYTLVEVIIAMAIGALLMGAVSSVVYTAWQAASVASSRVEASSQIRSFESFAYDDFATSTVPITGECGTSASPCHTEPIVLSGETYTWNGSSFVDRHAGSVSIHAATDVTAFSWYVDANSTVVVSLTVQVQAYSESQTFRFYPRINNP